MWNLIRTPKGVFDASQQALICKAVSDVSAELLQSRMRKQGQPVVEVDLFESVHLKHNHVLIINMDERAEITLIEEVLRDSAKRVFLALDTCHTVVARTTRENGPRYEFVGKDAEATVV